MTRDKESKTMNRVTRIKQAVSTATFAALLRRLSALLLKIARHLDPLPLPPVPAMTPAADDDREDDLAVAQRLIAHMTVNDALHRVLHRYSPKNEPPPQA